MRPNSRIVGYATISLVTVAVLLLGWRLYTYTQLERDHVWVHFSGTGDLIGSLQEDDPVAILGVNVGQVENITSDTTGVRARLRFWRHQKIFRDARALNVGNGLMGMRYVLLEPGLDSAHPLDRDAFIEGSFAPGVAEVMSGIQDVVAKIREIQTWVNQQALGTLDQAPLHRKIMAKMAATDTLLQRIDRITTKAQNLGPLLRHGGSLGKEFADTLKTLEPNLVRALVATDTVLRQAQVLIVRTSGLTRTTRTLVGEVSSQLEPFSRDDSLLQKIQGTLKLVDALQTFVEGRTSIKTNFHIWGSNPSKHGE